MEGNLQFVAIIVTVLLAVGGAFWTIMTTMNRGFAEIRKETKEAMEKGFAEAEKAREKGFAEAARNLAEAKEAWKKDLAEVMEIMEKGFAEAEKAREKGFAEAEKAREKGFAEAEKAREKGFATAEKGLAEAKEAREKGFAEAKEERREIKDDMNRRFDAVETRIARLEAPYFQRSPEGQGVPVERVAEPRPLRSYSVAGGHAGKPEKTRSQEAEDGGESAEGPATPEGE